MAYFFSYLRRSARMLCAFAFMALIFHAVLLTSVPLRAAAAEILYLDLLLFAFAVACFVYGFFAYRSARRPVAYALRSGTSICAALPDPQQGADIRCLARCLRHENALSAARIADLESGIEDMREILSCWAHDVKTPLAVCELLADRAEAESIRPALRREIARIQGLVAHVLHVERVHHLHESLHMQPLALLPLIRAAIARNAPLLQARALEVDVDATPIEAMGDSQSVAYILDQLLSNAAKYAPEGGCVVVRLWRDEKAAYLQVRDSGPGIPRQDIARIFDRGFSGERGRGQPASSGMGLYFAKRSAQAMGARLTAESEPGLTAFTLFLPRFADYLEPSRATM